MIKTIKKLMDHKPLWTILICNLFLSLTVVLFQPLDFLLGFGFPIWNIWWRQLLLSAAITIILSFMMLVFPAKARRAMASISLSLGVAFLTQSLLFNDGRPFAMNESWPSEVENMFAWFGIVVFTVITTLYYQNGYEKRYDITFKTVACLLIAVQVINFTMLATSADKSTGKSDHFGENKYQQFIQSNDPDMMHLEQNILDVSMYRGMPFILKDNFQFDIETVFDASFKKPETKSDNMY